MLPGFIPVYPPNFGVDLNMLPPSGWCTSSWPYIIRYAPHPYPRVPNCTNRIARLWVKRCSSSTCWVGGTWEDLCLSTGHESAPFYHYQCGGVDTNMCTLVDASTPPCETLAIMHPTTTRDYQISLIESQGPNSRLVWLLRAGLADCANNPISWPGRTTISLPIEATKCINYYDQLLYARR